MFTIKHNCASKYKVRARPGYLMLWNTENGRMHSWRTVKKKGEEKKEKSHISFWDRPLIFTHFPYQSLAGCAGPALPYPSLPNKSHFRSVFDSQLKQVWVTERGDLVKAFSSLTQCGRRYQRAQEITLYRLPVSSLIFPVANISRCFACGVHILSLNIFDSVSTNIPARP